MNCSYLTVLILSNNTLHGQILFSSIFNLRNLKILRLAQNNLTRVIPNALANSSKLLIMDIGYNHISGQIPGWMGDLGLFKIIMPNNHIEGPIPKEFCSSGLSSVLGVLDLSMNNISGTLPSCLVLSNINHIHLSENRLRGPIPNSLCRNIFLETLDLSHNQLSGSVPSCLGNSSLLFLRYLVLKHNNLEGEIPNQLCQLKTLSLIDLSHNNLSSAIPLCLNVTAYEEAIVKIDYNSINPFGISFHTLPGWFATDESIELTTKNTSYSYKGRILVYLSGIDLSSNKLTGKIPPEMGNFHTIIMMNLSHNSLSGAIPPSLSKLGKIESLDLSYNNLSGSIPRELVELNFLAYFNVSYNNLSGKPPPRTAQFATDFDENSYWGNPLLCGKPLPKNCSKSIEEPSSSNPTKDDQEEDGGFMDIESFFQTFGVSYTVVLLGIAAVLYINPYWRRAWFYFIQRLITTCFYIFCH
ncbi:hypothetical protein COLO4_23952 [Corchorus olitorius]|uniref:Uncharacterized protein n=1 Tax=Corchorus olitorius TaxID=93759 RepID=A0A1R3IDV7_9ROSI|nr:hypothetical protein COLO4_23952 [Corchorus olitorius]